MPTVRLAQIFCRPDTFGASEKKLARWGLTPELVIPAAVDLARQAAAGKALVALDLGPIGQLLEPAGTLSPLEAYEIFARQGTGWSRCRGRSGGRLKP